MFILLNQLEKHRFVFEKNNIFSEDSFSIEGDLACVEIKIKLKTEGWLKLCFKSKEKLYGMTAVLKEYKYKKEKEKIDGGEYKDYDESFDNKKNFEFIKKLEKRFNHKKQLISILVFFILIFVTTVISIGLYYYFKSNNKKKVPK